MQPFARMPVVTAPLFQLLQIIELSSIPEEDVVFAEAYQHDV